MCYYQIHFNYGPEADDHLYYYGEDIKKLYSSREKAESVAESLIVEKYNSRDYVPIDYEIIKLEVE